MHRRRDCRRPVAAIVRERRGACMRAFLLLALVLASPAYADDALRARCLDVLSAYEDPAGAAEWRGMGSGAPVELLAIARDVSVSQTKRANAILALGWFPNADTRGYLASLASTEQTDGLFRRKAVYALGNGWGDAAVPDLTQALASSDIQLRAAAARALGKVGSVPAKEALRARLPVEPDGMVSSAITSALGGN